MELKRFRLDGKMYHYYEVTEDLVVDDLPRLKNYNESGYNDRGLAFDIETTSFEDDGEHRATMYCWQFGIDEYTYWGRTWNQFLNFIECLNERAEQAEITAIVWVANFSFEFQFIKGWFKWNRDKYNHPDIFAKNDREILYARWRNIEFRDSNALTGCGLSHYKKNYNLDVDKLVGDLDYELYRHSGTPMTNREIAYCINDVQVLTNFHKKYILNQFISEKKPIPLTSTGVVREDTKEAFKEESKEYQKGYLRFIRNCTPNEQLYTVFRQYLFRGGLVHANTSMCNATIEERAASYDLKSAHPSHMLQDLFPTKFHRVNKNLFNKVLADSRSGEYGFIVCAKFINIRASGWHSIESKNKLVDFSEDAVFENGRLAYASFIEVVLTNIDYFNYEKMYVWDKMEVKYLYETEMLPLPDFLRKMVCKYFYIKESTSKDTFEYNLAKRKLNSLFGMCATGLVESEVIFNEETNEFELSGNVKDYYELTRNLLLLPQWAIWIAAYTRKDIVDMLYITGCDSIYYDTDSDKIIHYDKYIGKIAAFNSMKMQINRDMETYEYDKKIFERLGCFEQEYITDPNGLKVLGAKRYVVKHDGKVQVTVAGMVKGSLEEYCKAYNLDVFDVFTNHLKLDVNFSKKQTTSYYDHEFMTVLSDYKGKAAGVHEKSCVAIYKIPFEMNIEREFLKRVLVMAEERKNQIYKGVL